MRFLLRRLGFYLIALLVAVTINFLIPRMMAGDPVQIMFARFQGRLSPEPMESLYQTFGFVRGPLHEQYAAYMSSLLQGNLGISVAFFPVPVAQVIGSALAWTLRLVGLATIISFTGGTLLGVIAAWRRGGFVDTIVLPITGILNSFPYFWLAMLALYI